MNGLCQVIPYMPQACRDALGALPQTLSESVSEVRLFAGLPMTVTSRGRKMSLSAVCTQAELDECLLMLCGYSVHTHEDEMKDGYITMKDGSRVGLSGTAVFREGRLCGMRDIRSLCFRIRRDHGGASAAIEKEIVSDGRIKSILICGAPSSGKTTVLRDLTGRLAASFAVTVLDERNELCPEKRETCEVLTGYPKETALMQAVRTLAPDVIVLDELANRRELELVMQAQACGVAIAATAHAADKTDLLRRFHDGQETALAFSRICWLDGRENPGKIRLIEDTAGGSL